METITYMTSLLTFYLKGKITCAQNFVEFKTPNTILGLIPLGAHTFQIPTDKIASTSTDFKLEFKRLVLGLIAALIGFSIASSSFLGMLILLLIGAGLIIDAFEIDLVVTTVSGKNKVIDFFIFEKGKADRASEQINARIYGRMDDTNNCQQTDRLIEAIVNK